MTELAYRAATPADLDFIVRLLVLDDVSGVDEASLPRGLDYAAALAAIDADPNQALYVVEKDGTPIGTFQLTFIPGIMRRGLWRGLVEAVHVVPEERGRGHGSAMILWAVEACRRRGCAVVQLTSNKKRLDAHRFYRRLGFAQSHEGFKLDL